jgi:hypothetical protein
MDFKDGREFRRAGEHFSRCRDGWSYFYPFDLGTVLETAGAAWAIGAGSSIGPKAATNKPATRMAKRIIVKKFDLRKLSSIPGSTGRKNQCSCSFQFLARMVLLLAAGQIAMHVLSEAQVCDS